MQTTSLAEVRTLYLGVDHVRRCSAGGQAKFGLMHFLVSTVQLYFYREFGLVVMGV